MTETKPFHVGDILSVIHDRLVSPSLMDGLYSILNWMTDDNLYTHQLIRASEECAPFLRQQFPDLAEVVIPDGLNTMERVTAWLSTIDGPEFRGVPRLPKGEHSYIDPVLELSHKIGHDKVIPVRINKPE